ncbi:MAG TPA: penicillin acylase family protein [Actinomycetota bacterium]|nr:penicillin acylase family protein [Actinomycetota bacterium]
MTDPLEEMRSAARESLPPEEGELSVPGLESPVEVLRDRWGIPYLSAGSLEDLWFAQGFVQASERLFQIELALRAANGRLAEWFGEVSIPADRFARTVGFHRIGALEIGRWSEGSLVMMRRFVEGARAWVAAMPAPPLEHRLLAVDPDLPDDLGPWAAMFAYVAWGLSGNWDRELLRLRLSERADTSAAALLPPARPGSGELTAGTTDGLNLRALARDLLDGLPRSSGQGSNNWVVAGSRTASGMPLLANDPHLLVQQPAAWFETHLRAPAYEARGVAFPFAPGIVIGTTGHHAWGLTNVSGDVQDLYVERLNDDGTEAEFDGGWEPVVVRAESVEVRGAETLTFEVRETRHGPILDNATVGVAGTEFEPLEGTFALRWTAVDGVVEPATLVDMARSRSFEEFRAAVRGLSCPGQNVVYADADGTIGYQCTGRYPLRRTGDGSAPVPGWSAEHEWDGWVPFEDLPWSEDPEAGTIVTANHRVHDDAYPHLLGLDFHPPFRAERIAEVLRETPGISVEQAAGLQVDTVSIPARRLLPLLLQADARSDAGRWALELLRDWDGDLGPGSAAAAVYEVWVGEIAALVLGRDDDPETFAHYFAWREAFVCSALPAMLEGNEPPPAGGAWDQLLGSALESTLAGLEARLGPDRDAWRWGALHHVRFGHPMAGLPGAGAMFVATDHELGGDEQTVLQAGIDARLGFDVVVVPSWRFVTDLGDPDAAVAILTTGQSGNPASPHWNDQTELWASGGARSAPFTRPAVEAAADRSLRLSPV